MTDFIMTFLGASIGGLTGGFLVCYLFLLEMDKRYVKKDR